jgi:hypothetical protein
MKIEDYERPAPVVSEPGRRLPYELEIDVGEPVLHNGAAIMRDIFLKLFFVVRSNLTGP